MGRVTENKRACLRVRLATEADRGAIHRLLAALGYEHSDPAKLAVLLAQVFARPDLALFLAVIDGAPSGLLLVSQRPQPHLGGVMVSIDELVVAAGARGQGVGRRLLRRARAYARLHHAVRIEVHTSRIRENYRRGFYPANGFYEADSALFRLAELETGIGPHIADTTTTSNTSTAAPLAASVPSGGRQ